MIRVLSTCPRSALLAGQAEAALAAVEVLECRIEGCRVEIRPELVGEIQLRVGQIPQQKVADAALAARTDEQIRLGQAAKLERRIDALLVDILCPQRTLRTLRRERLCGFDDVPTCSCSPLFAAVCASAAAIRACSRTLRRRRSPMKRSRTPFACSAATSRSSASTNRPMSWVTSSAGRRQFSLEKANTVSAAMPRSLQRSTQPRTRSTPSL
jgi:hypothetical protein